MSSLGICAMCGKEIISHGYIMFWKRPDGKEGYNICDTCHDEIRAKHPQSKRKQRKGQQGG